MAETISQRVNDLFSSYVEVEAEQYRLYCSDDEQSAWQADALGGKALDLRTDLRALRDSSANPDFLAAHLLLDLMLENRWDGLEAIEQDYDSQSKLIMLQSLADRTTGAVREECTKALATIGVTVEPETADPMLSLVREYQGLRDSLNGIHDDDEADRRWAEIVAPAWDTLTQAPPAPNSSAGAAAAIRLVRDESNGSYSPDLIRNVLRVVADALEGAR